MLDRVFTQLQQAQMIRVKLEVVALDSTIIKVHSYGTGTLKTTGRQLSAAPAVDGPPKIHLVAADARRALTVALSPGQAPRCP